MPSLAVVASRATVIATVLTAIAGTVASFL